MNNVDDLGGGLSHDCEFLPQGLVSRTPRRKVVRAERIVDPEVLRRDIAHRLGMTLTPPWYRRSSGSPSCVPTREGIEGAGAPE